METNATYENINPITYKWSYHISQFSSYLPKKHVFQPQRKHHQSMTQAPMTRKQGHPRIEANEIIGRHERLHGQRTLANEWLLGTAKEPLVVKSRQET